MEAVRKFLARKNIVFSAKRYFIDAMGAMAQGLFCTLLVGTILNTIGQQLHIGFLTEVIVTLGKGEGAVTYTIGGLCSAMVGPGMAVAIGRALEAPPLVLYSLIPVGFATNFMGGAGGPLAVLFVAILASEIGKAVSKETKIDILVTPIVTVLVGVGFAALIAALACASHFRVQVGAKIAPYLKESVSASMPTLSTSVSTSASELWNSISGYLQNILSSQHVSLEVLQAAEDPRDTMLSAIALCVGEALAYVMIFLVSFIVLLVLIHWAASVFDIFTRLPVIHSCNALLGGALGLVCGLVLCTVVLWAVKLVAPAAYSDAGLLSPSVMENSAIAGKLVGWNDGVSLFESNPANT